MSRVVARRRRTPRLAGHICPRFRAAVLPPNGPRLSCWLRARQGANTPLPLERSPPASFKRLLGTRPTSALPALPAPRLSGVHPLDRWLHKRSLEGREKCLRPRAIRQRLQDLKSARDIQLDAEGTGSVVDAPVYADEFHELLPRSSDAEKL